MGRAISSGISGPLEGEMRHTYADCLRARALLGYLPQTSIVEGLTQEVSMAKRER